MWPEDKATHLRRGDVWAYTPLKTIGVPGSDMVPFHKLTQWLTYSLLEPIEALGVRVRDISLLTALSEYRNGGFMLDIGLLTARRGRRQRSDRSPNPHPAPRARRPRSPRR